MKQFLLNISAPVRRHLFIYLGAFILISIAVSSALILRFEAGHPSSQIKTINDAIWWSAVGVSTIGIGNVVPESTSGRYLTLFLTVAGVVIFSVLTAKIASFFTEEEVRKDLNKVEKEIEGELAVDDRQIETKLEQIEKDVVTLKKQKK